MSLDVYLNLDGECVFEANITHNLGRMARAVSEDFYYVLWTPQDLAVDKAVDLLGALNEGILTLVSMPAHFQTFDAENGWGTYENLLRFVRAYRNAIEENPNATVVACR